MKIEEHYMLFVRDSTYTYRRYHGEIFRIITSWRGSFCTNYVAELYAVKNFENNDIIGIVIDIEDDDTGDLGGLLKDYSGDFEGYQTMKQMCLYHDMEKRKETAVGHILGDTLYAQSRYTDDEIISFRQGCSYLFPGDVWNMMIRADKIAYKFRKAHETDIMPWR